jgi:hypothetical protein
MIKSNLVRRLAQLEAELTPSSDDEEVIKITVRRLDKPADEPVRVIELRPIERNRRRRWSRNWND